MKCKSPKASPLANPAQQLERRNYSNVLSGCWRTARRNSAYAFAATLGIWLPKTQAATLINLDASTHALGALNVWTNTGSLSGDFAVPMGATSTPTNVVVDGVQGIFFESGGAGGGAAGSHYAGPTAPSSVCGANARTIEAWIHNPLSEGEHMVFAWGRRGADGLNNAFGHGTDAAFGAVGMWGTPDIGWGENPSQVATNRVVNRWTYIVQSFNGTTNAVYVDGRLANIEGPPATTLINTAELAEDLSTALPFRVARQTAAAGGPSGVGDFNIVIGRIRVQDVAMDSASISNQFFVEKGDFKLNDTDGDGMPDWWEARYGLNQAVNDAAADPDGDSLSNLGEYQKNTNPNDSDTDDDGLFDGVETGTGVFVSASNTGSSPVIADTDSDSLNDGAEVNTHLTDPNKGDTDGDILSDGAEVGCGSNPLNAGSICGLLNRAIELDATGLATGLLTNWPNSGFIAGDFSVPTNATVPAVVTLDGVKGVALQAVPAGANGTHYFGPATTADVTGGHARAVEAWVYDVVPQGEKIIIAWGGRNTGNGSNYPFGIGTDNAWGAVGAWGDPDIGWNDAEVRGRWTHLAATWDGTATRLYSEGVLVNTEVLPSAGGQTINTLLNAPSDGLPYHFRIGRQNGNTTFTSIDGTGEGPVNIARVRVYTNSLDGATIKARFDSEKGFFGLTDPDGDGMPSWYELRYGLNPNDATGANGASGNPDADGLTNAQEYNLGTNPTDADSDDDFANDGAELTRVDTGLPAPPSGAVAATNPLNPDTDGDGLLDGRETDTGTFVGASNTGTDPLVGDTDGDTFADGLEVSQGSNPTLIGSVPSSDPIINLVATNLTLGPLVNWTNSGTFSNGLAFVCTNAVVPGVQVVQGVKAVRMPGNNLTGPFYTGPNAEGANVTGNSTYSIEAWVLNESPQATEETIFSWGRRTGTGVNASFNHGISAAFGAMGHFGAPDLGWGSNALAAASNVIMDRWTHLVYTYNGLTLQQQAYVDGVRVNFEQLGAALQIAVTNSGGGLVPFRVGSQTSNNGNPTGDFRASGLSIAELRVYTLTLSAADVQTRFNNGVSIYGITDPDSDGIPSWYERTYPTCLNENVQADAANDCDSDGLDNLTEYTYGTSPIDTDSDDDGLTDGAEVNTHGTNPRNSDTDQDGLPDGREVFYGSAPVGLNTADTDADGFFDATEVVYGSDPTNSVSTPNLSTPVPFVVLDATDLPVGPLANWTNRNALGWNFVGGINATGSVQVVDGSKGVGFFSTNHYVGPRIPYFFGGNTNRTVEAWIFNPTRQGEETVFAWGARGADGRNSGFSHGSDGSFGALQFWGGAADVPWGSNATHIASNVITGQWTHVAYTYQVNPLVNEVRSCYTNGALAYFESTFNHTNFLNTYIYDPLDPLNAPPNTFGRTLPFRVGAQSENDGTFAAGAARPTMTIARVKAYDVALSAAQIAANYNAERVAFPGQPVIRNVRVDGTTGFVSFDWTPAVGHTYEVQRNDNVANPGGWSAIATGQSSGSFTNNPGGIPRFYRLRIEP